MSGPAMRALFARTQAVIGAVRQLPPRAAIAREMQRIRRSEIHGSTALAGSELRADEVDTLLDRGRVDGNHLLSDYVLVRAYADAARWIADARAFRPGDRQPLISVDELRQLHTRATAGSGLRGGAWRQGNPAQAAGIVAPAAWLVAREVTTLLDRFGRGPHDDPLALWLARFLGRFARLLPFEGANGRTARLAANLMLRRLDVVPLWFDRRDRLRYADAIAAAETSEANPLAAIIARSIVRTGNRVTSAATIETGLSMPLRELAGSDYAALAKAAQRGSLRTIVRGGRYFTTPDWIAEYRAKRPILPARSRVRLIS